MDNLPIVEDVLEKNIYTYSEHGDFEGEIAWRNISKQEIKMKLLQYNNY